MDQNRSAFVLELQGFGTYQYGMRWYGKAFPEGVASEKGMYKYEFDVPEAWRTKQVYIIFEASMTDTEVKINGQKAGEMHQGAFYRFSYDIGRRLKFGKKEPAGSDCEQGKCQRRCEFG